MEENQPQKRSYASDLVRIVERIIRSIPLLGRLCDSKRSSISAASKEIVISTLFSTLPIWFFPTIYTFFFKDTPPLLTNMKSSVDQGDLYIYSSALIGPLIFAITYNYAEWGDQNNSPSASRIGKLTFVFPYGLWFFCISIFISMIAIICFGLMRFESSGFISAKLNKDSLLNVSIVMYLASLICLFLVSVYRNDLADVSNNDSGATKDFVNDWNKRHG